MTIRRNLNVKKTLKLENFDFRCKLLDRKQLIYLRVAPIIMDFKRNILLPLFMAGSLLTANSQQDINFTALTIKDGLSSNTVTSILRDHYGFMWFGTEDGLNKFDGTNFKVYRYRPNDSSNLQTNEILSLHEDQ